MEGAPKENLLLWSTVTITLTGMYKTDIQIFSCKHFNWCGLLVNVPHTPCSVCAGGRGLELQRCNGSLGGIL